VSEKGGNPDETAEGGKEKISKGSGIMRPRLKEKLRGRKSREEEKEGKYIDRTGTGRKRGERQFFVYLKGPRKGEKGFRGVD